MNGFSNDIELKEKERVSSAGAGGSDDGSNTKEEEPAELKMVGAGEVVRVPATCASLIDGLT